MDRDFYCFPLSVVLDQQMLITHMISDFCEENTEQAQTWLQASTAAHQSSGPVLSHLTYIGLVYLIPDL